MTDSNKFAEAAANIINAAVAAERARWLKAVVSETYRDLSQCWEVGLPVRCWANELNGEYNADFYPTRTEAEAAALRYVEEKNKP